MLRILRHILKPLLQQHIARKQNINHSIQTVTCWRKKIAPSQHASSMHTSRREQSETRENVDNKRQNSRQNETHKNETQKVSWIQRSLFTRNRLSVCALQIWFDLFMRFGTWSIIKKCFSLDAFAKCFCFDFLNCLFGVSQLKISTGLELNLIKRIDFDKVLISVAAKLNSHENLKFWRETLSRFLSSHSS